MKFAFFGTPALTIPLLESLLASGLVPALIITSPDKPQGRKLALTPPATKLWAIEHNIPYLQPEKLDQVFIDSLASEQFDLFVVVAYGKILPESLINLPAHGTLNVHYSLLPKYRGATPVESAILNGETQTGISIQKMRYKLDSGPILKSESFDIPATITAPELRDQLNQRAAALLPNTITAYVAGRIIPTEQDESSVSNCHKIEKEDGLIDPKGDPIENDRKFRAYFGWPGSYFFITQGERSMRIIIKDAALVDGAFVIKRVVPEGKREMNYSEFLKQIS